MTAEAYMGYLKNLQSGVESISLPVSRNVRSAI
jgi:hypothetical protein